MKYRPSPEKDGVIVFSRRLSVLSLLRSSAIRWIRTPFDLYGRAQGLGDYVSLRTDEAFQ